MEQYLSKKEHFALLNHLQDITSGRTPWEHPGAPDFHPGMPYEPNEDEKIFMERTAQKMQMEALKQGLLWGLTPLLLFRIPQLRSRLFHNINNPGIICFGFGVCGYLTGAHKNADAIAEERVRLESSPLAKETRYQLWKYNNQHPWLIGFEQEFENVQIEVRPRVGDPVQKFHEQQAAQDMETFSVDDWFKSDHIPTIPKQETLEDIRRHELEQKRLRHFRNPSHSFQRDHQDDFDDAFVKPEDFGIPDDRFISESTDEWK